ncbi:MAG: DUF4169 family protein [Pseudomonadota bacterium]
MSVVNFNKARKARAKAQRRAKADQNAAKHGRGKAQKAADTRERDAHKSHVDLHKIEKLPEK